MITTSKEYHLEKPFLSYDKKDILKKKSPNLSGIKVCQEDIIKHQNVKELKNLDSKRIAFDLIQKVIIYNFKIISFLNYFNIS